MADRTGIEWTDSTWNPIVGCSVVSPGCTNCYAMKMAARIEAMQPGSHYAGTTHASKAGAVWTGKLALAPDSILTQPLRWRRPRRIFVNSMGDLFHEDVPDAWIDRVFAVMALTPQHTYQVLTKRSARMREYFAALTCQGGFRPYIRRPGWTAKDPRDGDAVLLLPEGQSWPLPNVWLGVSIDDQRRADERVPDLLATPAAIRFVSAEPLLGLIRFSGVSEDGKRQWNWLTGETGVMYPDGPDFEYGPRIDLAIVGGESGPNARPMHPDWARSLRDQCAAAGTAFFFKQWGEWAPRGWKADGGTHAMRHTAPDWGCFQEIQSHPDSIERVEPAPDGWQAFAHVGKRAAGRLLDGVEHNAMPEVRP